MSKTRLRQFVIHVLDWAKVGLKPKCQVGTFTGWENNAKKKITKGRAHAFMSSVDIPIPQNFTKFADESISRTHPNAMSFSHGGSRKQRRAFSDGDNEDPVEAISKVWKAPFWKPPLNVQTIREI